MSSHNPSSSVGLAEGDGQMRETFTGPGRSKGDAAVEGKSMAPLVKMRRGEVKLAAGFCWPRFGWVA